MEIYRKDRLPTVQGQFTRALSAAALTTPPDLLKSLAPKQEVSAREARSTIDPPQPDRLARATRRGSSRAVPAPRCLATRDRRRPEEEGVSSERKS